MRLALLAFLPLLLGCPQQAPLKPQAPKAMPATVATSDENLPEGPQPLNADFPGVTCFRGSASRDYYGEGPIPTGKVEVLWRAKIGGAPIGHWSGVGWTGQPLLIEWPDDGRRSMNFLQQPGPERELIVGALDGQVHFFDADTGKRSRKALPVPGRYPIKGTISVDPRGYPLLYVGCGVDVGGKAGFRVFSLTDFRQLLVLPALGVGAPRKWPGSDSNVLVLDDTLYLPAENGLFYKVRLNSTFVDGRISIAPKVEKFKISKAGTENSMAVRGGIGYFSDNYGALYACPLDNPKSMKQIAELGDDTDSSPVLDNDGNLYLGIEKDKRTARDAKGVIYKVSPQGKVLWKWGFEAQSITNVKPPANPINGGILSTGALSEDQETIYYTTSHHPRLGRGFLVALDTATGHLRWKKQLAGYSWSSPIVRDGVVAACDSMGSVYVLNAADGESLLDVERLKIGANIEATPIVWKGKLYVGVRGGSMVCLGKKE